MYGQFLRGANLSKTDLRGAELAQTDLREAQLHGADLYRASLWRANLSKADLSNADLSSANLNGVIAQGANFQDANLRFARMTAADVSGANFTGCSVYGCSFWNLQGTPREQFGIVITPKTEPAITVDNIEVAQFIYLLLKNQKIRDVIDTITAKVVLILGRFTPERKAILEHLKHSLRIRNYLPIIFDFDGPTTRDLTETVSTLAHMARFVIADITDAKSIPQELEHIVPHLPSVPVVPLLLASQAQYGMFEHIQRYPWVLTPFQYETEEDLLAGLEAKVIVPAETATKQRIMYR